MFISSVFLSFPFWVLVASTTPIQGTDDQTIQSSTTLNLTNADLLIPSNTSIQDPNAPSGSNFLIRCDGAKYGFNPSLSDCESARAYIATDSEQFAFGDRHTGLPDSIFPLPFIIMGDKAECFFQPINVGDGPTGHASMTQIRSAASALFLQCASSDPSQGGIARNIGGDNNMAVIMGVFRPNVHCRGTLDTPGSCRHVLADMPASTDLEVFGPRDAPFVKEVLPQEIVSADDECVLRLYSTGGTDVVAWYRIWEAAEATFAVCGMEFKGGSVRGLGQQGNVFITLGARPPAVSAGNVSDDATA